MIIIPAVVGWIFFTLMCVNLVFHVCKLKTVCIRHIFALKKDIQYLMDCRDTIRGFGSECLPITYSTNISSSSSISLLPVWEPIIELHFTECAVWLVIWSFVVSPILTLLSLLLKNTQLCLLMLIIYSA